MSHPGVRPKPPGSINANLAAWVTAAIVFACGMLVTAMIAWFSYTSFQRQLRERFELLANERFTRIEERFIDQVRRLDSLRRLFAYSQVVTRSEFNGYVQPLLDRTLGYNWAPRVSAAARQGFEAAARADGIKDFSIRELDADGNLVPAQARESYVPVLFAQSDVQIEVPLGYDMWSAPQRRQTLARAEASGTFALSPPVRLVGNKGRDPRGVLMAVPVLAPWSAVTQGRAPIAGFVGALISVPLLMTEGLPSQVDDNLQVRIRDVAAPPADALLYESPVSAGELDLTAIQHLSLADRNYEVLIRPSDVYAHGNQSSPLLRVISLGALLSLLLSTLLYSLMSQRQRALTLVHERTLLLQARDRLLQKLSAEVPGGIYQYLQMTDGTSRFTYVSHGLCCIYELPAEELLRDARPAFTRIHADDVERVSQSIAHSAEYLQRWGEEYRVNLPVAGLRWVRGEATPERLEDGSTLWHGYFTDISDLKRVEEELRALSITDSLTGIYNRRYFQERLKTELGRAEREGLSLAVIMLDIDHFKHINDTFGHAQGDQVLQVLCQRIAERLRRSDVFCRLGGEEFMVLCPSSGSEQAHALAMELWRGLRGKPVEGIGVVTASFGIACWRPGEGVDALLLRADSGVYAAKQAGRDRVQPELA